MGKLRVSVRGYRRKGYRRKGAYVDPSYVDPHTKLVPDRGKPGRTPKAERWFKPKGTLGGWDKDQSASERRRRAARGRSDLSSGRALQALANVTTDRETKSVAKQDADYFFKKVKRR